MPADDPNEPQKKPVVEQQRAHGSEISAPLGDINLQRRLTPEEQLEEAKRIREEAERVQTVRGFCERLVRDLEPGHVGSINALVWMRGLTYGQTAKTMPEGKSAHLSWFADTINSTKAEASAKNSIPVCFLHVRSGLPLFGPQANTDHSDRTAPSEEVLRQLAALLAVQVAQGKFLVILNAEAGLHRLLNVQPNRALSPAGLAGFIKNEALTESLGALAPPLRNGKHDFILGFATVSQTCERGWVRGPKEAQLRATTSDFLGAESLDQTTGLPKDPRGAVREVIEVWQISREAVKDRLELAIAGLSSLTYGTFEEKRQVTDELNQAMNRWGFVAIAPSTGLPSYLRCRMVPKNPRGFFYFEALPNAVPVAEPDSEAKEMPVKLPAFRLSDPPESPARKPEQEPI